MKVFIFNVGGGDAPSPGYHLSLVWMVSLQW